MALRASWLPVTWRGNFPHLSPLDREIWLRFLDQQASAWQTFAYDVAVGGQDAPPGITDEPIRRAWKYSTAKRIDAVGQRPEELSLFEVRPDAQASAIGHLLTYLHLFREENPDPRPVRLYLVTDYIADDVRRVATAQRIAVLTYPPPEQRL